MEPDRALELAYRFMNQRERTEFEVRSRLERAECPPEAVEAAVAELIELGYVNDERYARLFTQDRRTLDAWGSDRIARSLRQRGVAAELIDAALAEDQSTADLRPSHAASGVQPDVQPDVEPVSELGRAIALLGERFPAGPGSDRDRNRAFGVLARKGYESEIAADAVRAWAHRLRG